MLPVKYLDLSGTDLVALIVHSHIAAVLPDSGEGDIVCRLEGDLSVHIDSALCSNASGLGNQIFHIQVVKTCLRHINSPLSVGTAAGQQHIALSLVGVHGLNLSLKCTAEQVNLHT